MFFIVIFEINTVEFLKVKNAHVKLKKIKFETKIPIITENLGNNF